MWIHWNDIPNRTPLIWMDVANLWYKVNSGSAESATSILSARRILGHNGGYIYFDV